MFSKEISDIISTTDSCIGFLRERRVLRALPPLCPECNERAIEEKDSGRGDKREWRCWSHRNFSKTIWSGNSTVKMAGEFLDLSKKTIIVWFKLYRHICSKWMAANQPIIGGVGHVVQVDEEVISRAKYHRGRRARERWPWRPMEACQEEAQLKYSPGIWMNISGGRDTGKTDQLPLRTYYHTSQRFTLKIAKISQIYNFFSNFVQ